MNKYTDEELVNEIKRVSEQNLNGERPTREKFDEYAICSCQTCTKRFGSWSNALEEAGFDYSKEKYTEEQILEKVKQFCEEYERFSMNKWDADKSYPSKTAFYNRFDSTEEAFDLLDIDNSHHTRDDLISEMNRMVDSLNGKTPTPSYATENSEYGVNSFVREFGSWTDAIKECGYQPRRNRDFGREELIDDIKRVSQMDDTSDKPRLKDITEKSKFGIGSFRREFGKWNDVLEAAGIEPKSQEEWVLSGEDHPFWQGGKEYYYGPSWHEKRNLARERDNYECTVCSKEEEYMSRELNVHHIKPRREWDISEHEEMNSLSNLVSLCTSCHNKLEGKWKETNRDEFVIKAKRMISNE